jgi:hypothetical protein
MKTTKIGEIAMDEHKADVLRALYESGNFNPNFGFIQKADGQVVFEVYAEGVPKALISKLEVTSSK